MHSSENRIEFLNTFYDDLSLEEVLRILKEHVLARKPGFMSSLNMQMLVTLDKDERFTKAFNESTMVLMDSQPLFNFAKKMGKPIHEKLSGSDIIFPISEYAEKNGFSCYILGGAEGVPEKAAEELKKQFPKLRIAGTCSPPRGFLNKQDEMQILEAKIKKASPDIVFVCISSPDREIFASTALKEWGVPFSFCVGAAVDFVSGNVKRAPAWVSKMGFEWLYRVFQDPKRLFKRYFVESWHFISIYRRYK